MIDPEKKIGIWGLGVVGTSAVNYFYPKFKNIQLIEKKELDIQTKLSLQEKGIEVLNQNLQLETFLKHNDYILFSPGIDLRPYKEYQHKWLPEVDIFRQVWKKPIIAVTGTVGKTSIVHLLSEILKANGIKVATGGNIGIGMLDILKLQDSSDIAVLELSSYQLEHCKIFNPEIAVWTNLFENHLDHHTNMQEYFEAKLKIILHQNKSQKAILPVNLQEPILNYKTFEQNLIFFDEKNYDKKILKNFKEIIDLTYKTNWIIIDKVLENLNIKNPILPKLELPEHRLDFVGEINGRKFYNDSKSTIAQATLAAVEKLNNKSVVLFLGGISKGVNRSNLVASLKNKVKYILCFGGEAEQLYEFCKQHLINASAHKNLEDAFEKGIEISIPGDILLFSPAGASFDLFKDYKDRGNKFKQLVQQYKLKNSY
ncbi:UDP-N-acetylmuramoyl-L-alanine--D-glutamate ligase [Candidatus Dependentiae bacterium]|nr:UDP-N-acetylmuramoyl-L-alanine--D-glutamate ligase [Candidatus Dependentiae bacterium]